MAQGNHSTEDRNEPATPRRLEKAREAGKVPVSRETTAFVTMVVVFLILRWQANSVLPGALRRLGVFVGRGYDHRLIDGSGIEATLRITAQYAAPTLVGAGLCGALAVLAQTRFLARPQALAPDLNRINPVNGLKRIFGPQSLAELGRSLLKLCLVTAALWFALHHEAGVVATVIYLDPHKLWPVAGALLFRIFVAVLATQTVIGVADLAWVHFKHLRDLRMSKRDIREEYKEMEGNPQTKARRRAIGISRARRRMMHRVPKATVVITNPTHYAVALEYDRVSSAAPRIVAKGADLVAQRIRELAQSNGVPIVSNPPLARALYRFELDTEIPAEHYKAVAEVIAFIWRLRRRA